MNMKVINALSSIPTNIRHQPISVLREPRLARHLSGHQEQSTQHRLVSWICMRDGYDRLLWDHKNVGRGLGLNVPESQDFFVLKHLVRRNLTIDDSLKNSHLIQ